MTDKSVELHPGLITTQQAADLLAIQLPTLREWIYAGALPGIVRPGPAARLIRFDREILSRWIREGCPRIKSDRVVMRGKTKAESESTSKNFS